MADRIDHDHFKWLFYQGDTEETEKTSRPALNVGVQRCVVDHHDDDDDYEDDVLIDKKDRQ